MIDDHHVVSARVLRDFASSVLARVGMSPDDAADVADAMVWADLRGLDAHGVSVKLPQCVARIEAGGSPADAPIEVVHDAPGVAVLDAHHAWGQVAATRAMRHAIDKARVMGVGAAVVHDACSAAAMGYYPSLAVEAHMIGMAFTNGPPLIAPWGATTKLLGNQAHAVGCPTGRHAPIIYDSATTAMSTGEMDMHRERGELLPEGVLFDEYGQPTRDPSQWATGLLAPAGGARGYALSLAFEILTGVLAGGDCFAPRVGHAFAVDRPQGVSLLTIAIDPESALPYDEFVGRVDELIDQIHASALAPGVDRVYFPGERAALIAKERARDGIPLPAARAERLRSLGFEPEVQKGERA